jgi:hypothetical protein
VPPYEDISFEHGQSDVTGTTTPMRSSKSSLSDAVNTQSKVIDGFNAGYRSLHGHEIEGIDIDVMPLPPSTMILTLPKSQGAFR